MRKVGVNVVGVRRKGRARGLSDARMFNGSIGRKSSRNPGNFTNFKRKMGGIPIMRLLPIFLIILFFAGTIIFTIMAWATIRFRNDELIPETNGPVSYTFAGEGEQMFFNTLLNSGGGTTSDEAKLYGPKVARKVEQLKMKIISKLRHYIISGGKSTGHVNQYGVNYTKLKYKWRINRDAIFCKIQKLKFDILYENENVLLRDKAFPTEPLIVKGEDGGPRYRSCAVVPNSAALLGSKHGIDIDSSDFILRFNNAPVEGYEDDVGGETTMRIVNSKVVTKPEFAFPYGENSGSSGDVSRSLWDQTKKFLIWDPCNYTDTLNEWISRPEFPVFDKYFNLTSGGDERNRFYMLNCRVIWTLWELLQQFTFTKIHGTPPTSGFMGIILAMQNCEQVRVYEYIPSVRESELCRYYSNETNPTCTYGGWHSVSAEKLFFLGLTNSPDKEIYMDGVLSLPGVAALSC